MQWNYCNLYNRVEAFLAATKEKFPDINFEIDYYVGDNVLSMLNVNDHIYQIPGDLDGIQAYFDYYRSGLDVTMNNGKIESVSYYP